MAPGKMYVRVLAAGFASMSFAIGLTNSAFCDPQSYLQCMLELCLLLLHPPSQVVMSPQDKDRSAQDNNLNALNAHISSRDRQGRKNMYCTPVPLYQVQGVIKHSVQLNSPAHLCTCYGFQAFIEHVIWSQKICEARHDHLRSKRKALKTNVSSASPR